MHNRQPHRVAQGVTWYVDLLNLSWKRATGCGVGPFRRSPSPLRRSLVVLVDGAYLIAWKLEKRENGKWQCF